MEVHLQSTGCGSKTNTQQLNYASQSTGQRRLSGALDSVTNSKPMEVGVVKFNWNQFFYMAVMTCGTYLISWDCGWKVGLGVFLVGYAIIPIHK